MLTSSINWRCDSRSAVTVGVPGGAENTLSRSGNPLDGAKRLRQAGTRMAKVDETHRLSWPWWASWALLAVALTSALTLAATFYDIL